MIDTDSQSTFCMEKTIKVEVVIAQTTDHVTMILGLRFYTRRSRVLLCTKPHGRKKWAIQQAWREILWFFTEKIKKYIRELIYAILEENLVKLEGNSDLLSCREINIFPGLCRAMNQAIMLMQCSKLYMYTFLCICSFESTMLLPILKIISTL